ncbi:MAG: asparagine synthetase B, partial [Ignavibacteria bacterium]|nr:asparagine synthetase B [Ignavibacteria bacterium]
MCGIAGIFRFENNTEDLRTRVIRMTANLAHRGPDAWGTYLSRDIALGHARLSIVDLSMGHQPMEAEDYVIAYNGEVYNYIELRQELEQLGVVFTTHSDTEVVMKAYKVWGKNA